VASLLAACLLSICGEARAYTWMLRHGYTGCGTCHQDPTGGSLLTPYGRALGGIVLRTQYGGGSEEPQPVDDFLFGAVSLPEGLMLGGDVRGLWMNNKFEGTESTQDQFLMQADLHAGVRISRVVGAASVGYAETGAFSTTLTRAPEKNLVSRFHWLGYEFTETGLLLRGGRMNLPFGIRTIEHTLWTRALTGTGINDDQQHGLAVSWTQGTFRAELMAILGNYQLRPDAYRERGYSGFFEWLPEQHLALGLSSLMTYRELEPTYLRETWRHAHGVFARWATPWQPLVVLAEADYVFRSPKNDFHREGFVSYAQADVEPIQGLHFLLTGEAHNVGVTGTPFSWAVWVSQQWFVAPHVDVRIDNVYQSLGDEFGRASALSLLAQAHIYL
jgi:hypothetical protein